MSDDLEDDAPDWGLTVPFVAVQSVGGEYDDDGYVAGWEAGRLSILLEQGAAIIIDRGVNDPAVPCLAVPVHTGNVDQLDLVAMQHGFRMKVDASETAGWSDVVFYRFEETT